MNSTLIQLIVLAAIAIFLILKLRSVLGTREGYEKPPEAPEAMPSRNARDFEVIEGGKDHDILGHVAEGSDAAQALAAMKKAEAGFSVTEFLQGARGAYEWILTAFDKGDIDQLRPFLGADIAAAFAAAIDGRKEQGLTVESTFVGLREMALHDARFDPTTKRGEITLRYVGELTSVVRDASGEIVEGNPKEIKRQRDVWTFARVMGSADPNWQLVATGE